MGVKDHGEGLAAPLGMPKHAALAVGLGGAPGGGNGFSHREILVVPRQDFEGVLAVLIKADKIFQDIQKAGLFKQALEEGIKLGVPGVLVAAVGGFPGHVPVLAGGDGPGLGGGEVAHDTDGVVGKEGGQLVDVVAELPVGGGGVGFLPGGGFQLHHHQGQAVDKEDDVRPLLRALDDGPLVGDGKIVVTGVLVVRQIDQGGALLAVLEIPHRHAVLEVVGKGHVPL